MAYSVLWEIHDERGRQDQKWGAPTIAMRSAEVGLRVLGEKFGEACKAVNDRNREACRVELVQVAAVAVSMIEAIDQGAPLVK